MSISIFDLFSIGVGPSSSHTVGPMRAAFEFVCDLKKVCALSEVYRLEVHLYGSLALTGEGHGTDRAILNGLEGARPETVLPDLVFERFHAISHRGRLLLGGLHHLCFDVKTDLLFHKEQFLERHSNGMIFKTFTSGGDLLFEETFYSVGGGFIVRDQDFLSQKNEGSSERSEGPYPFHSAEDLLTHCREQGMTISELIIENEKTWKEVATIHKDILAIVDVMEEAIARGCRKEGILPGGLNVKRRAPDLYKKLLSQQEMGHPAAHGGVLNWPNLYALAVNEENAAGGRVVTAPTNGASGVIPAVWAYYKQYFATPYNRERKAIEFMATAGAIGILYKKGASISAAEVGCQGEVGVASSMAAGALTAVLGGTIDQIEKAAEMGMEHHLGLTCDPIGGLVQIPCIERNAMGAVQAVNAAHLALMETGEHLVSLDKVIATMLQTGRDMCSTYKETSLGGLAVNLPGC